MNHLEENEELPRNKRRNRETGKKKWILLLLILLIIGCAVGGFIWWKSRSVMDDTTKYWFDKMAENGTLKGKSPQEIQQMLDTIVEEGKFNVSVNARVVFDNGKSKGSLGIENIPANHYYSRVILKKEDDGTVLYESKGIKPGQFIDEIKLSKNLPKGEYNCIAQIIATDPESYEDIGQVQVKVQVIVLN